MKHGKNWVYLKGCRCDLCRDAHRIYERDRQRSIRREKYGFEVRSVRWVDAQEAREHLLFLRDKKIGLTTIAERAGVSRATLQAIRGGKNKLVTVRVHKKILAVSSIPSKKGHYVDPTEALRLIQELETHGVTLKDVARETGRDQIVIKNHIRLKMLEDIRRVHKQKVPQA
jgi:hypothetical protein